VDLGDAVSAVGLGVGALVLAGLAWRASARSADGPRLLAWTRCSEAIGCAALAASHLVPHGFTAIALLLTAAAALVTSTTLESIRRRRIVEKRPQR
jgi:hypothetical protein